MKRHRNKKRDSSLAMIQSYFPFVEMVKDATQRAVVEVTADDNTHSDVKSHKTCALALACKRFFHADGVIIGLTTSWIIINKTAMRFMNSGTTSREITSFDRKAGFDAGKYLLTPATDSNRLGSVRAKNPDRHGKGGPKRAFRHYTRNVRTSLRWHGAEVA
jgi:hypothetical protein